MVLSYANSLLQYMKEIRKRLSIISRIPDGTVMLGHCSHLLIHLSSLTITPIIDFINTVEHTEVEVDKHVPKLYPTPLPNSSALSLLKIDSSA